MVFGKLIKILQTPDSYSEAVERVWGEDARLKFKSSTFITLRPGDIITFTYDGRFSARRSLVVGTAVHPGGYFVSTKSNYLLCTYELSDSLPSLINVFQSFYNNRNIKYNHMRGTMTQVFGLTSFKTFNMDKMSGIYKLTVV